MGILSATKNAIGTAFGYDATETGGKRKSRGSTIKSEDKVLTDQGRNRLTSESSDLRRNFALLAWAVRKHLDYVASFNFQARTGIRELDDQIEKYIRDESKAHRFDITGRHDLHSYLRTLEGCAVIGGDCGSIRLKSGHLQAIETDRIKNPPKPEMTEDSSWVQGVKVDQYGRPVEYAIHNRNQQYTGTTYEKSIPSSNFHLHAYLDRFDQVRGVTPLSAGLNSLIDVYEGIGYTLAKMKVEQLFAMLITRNGSDAAGELSGGLAADDESEDRSEYKVDFGKGPTLLDMDPGEDAKFLKSDTPGANTQKFLETVIMLTIKSLDLPMSFYNEAHTNFFGSRSAWLHYEKSSQPKRHRLTSGFLSWWTVWKLRQAIITGKIKFPKGLKLDESLWEWVPVGMPWWDPVKEVNGEVLAISNGLTTPQAVCKARGTNYEDNIRDTAIAMKIAEDAGVPLAWASAGTAVAVDDEQDDEDDDQTKPNNEGADDA